MTDNIRGIFTLDLDGQNRELKCNFSAIEHLERNVFKRPAIQVLADAIDGVYITHEIVDTILTGLKANGDTRFKRDSLGEEVLQKGVANYVEFYLKYLTYAISGSSKIELEEESLV